MLTNAAFWKENDKSYLRQEQKCQNLMTDERLVAKVAALAFPCIYGVLKQGSVIWICFPGLDAYLQIQQFSGFQEWV